MLGILLLDGDGARVTGVVDAASDVAASLEGSVSARASGRAGVNDVLVTDGTKPIVKATRAEVAGVEARWPAVVSIDEVRLVGPAATVERDADGELSFSERLDARRRERQPAAGQPERAAARSPRSERRSIPIEVRNVRVDGGALTWIDNAVTPRARAAVSGIQASVRDGAWPSRGPHVDRTACGSFRDPHRVRTRIQFPASRSSHVERGAAS